MQRFLCFSFMKSSVPVLITRRSCLNVSIFGEICSEFDFGACVLAWHVIYIFCFWSTFLIYFSFRIVLPNIKIFKLVDGIQRALM